MGPSGGTPALEGRKEGSMHVPRCGAMEPGLSERERGGVGERTHTHTHAHGRNRESILDATIMTALFEASPTAAILPATTCS